MKKHELLEKAMRDYPAGTKFENESTASGVYRLDEEGDIQNIENSFGGHELINGYVYYNGEWAPLWIDKPKPVVEEIYFRGPQGCGKTTKIEMLVSALTAADKNNGIESCVIRDLSDMQTCLPSIRIPYSTKKYEKIIVVMDGAGPAARNRARDFAKVYNRIHKLPVIFIASVQTI